MDSDLVGWACTLIQHPALIPEFVAAGWIRGGLPPGRAGTHDAWIVAATLLPGPGSPEWESLWGAPLDPVFTNVIFLDPEGAAHVRADRSSLSMAAAKSVPCTVSTLLPWPWSAGAGEQERWLAAVSRSLRLLALGVMDCDVGVQFVVPLDAVEALRQRLSEFLEATRQP